MTAGNTVSVIIHTYYRYDYLVNVLKLLSKQTVKPLEVIVSDQTPLKDRPKGFYENFKDLPLNIIDLDRPMHAPAQNIGAKSSRGEVLLFLDDDGLFKHDLLEKHLEIMNKENVDVVVGPNSLTERLSDRNEYPPNRRKDLISLFMKKVSHNWEGMVIYTTGGNTSMKRDIFFSVGGYDEKLPRMADVEIGFRLFKSGAKIYHSVKPFVHHLKSDEGGSRKAQHNIPYLRLVSYLYIYKKHFPGWSTSQFYLREILNYLVFKDPINGRFHISSFKNPLKPLINFIDLIRARNESERLLN